MLHLVKNFTQPPIFSSNEVHLEENNCAVIKYRLGEENVDSTKNMLLLKNPQFFPNHYETLVK